MNETEKVLDTNEQVLWEGKPKFWPYFLSNVIPSFFMGIILMVFLAPFVAVNFIAKPGVSSGAAVENSFFLVWNVMLIPFVIIGMWMLVGGHIYTWLLYKHLHYTITNKRVIMQRGLIGRDFEYVDFDQITNAEVSVGLWDKLVGKTSGSIRISSAGSLTAVREGRRGVKPYTMSHIDKPYEVFKFFKKVSHDVKTDIQYPNQMRPSVNPGYQSSYVPASNSEK